MQTTKVKVTPSTDEPTTLPVVLPGLDEVRTFAGLLHRAAQAWQGELWGWPAEYTPESRRKPLDSKMTFTPAEFWIGVSGIWFFSMMWEDGRRNSLLSSEVSTWDNITLASLGRGIPLGAGKAGTASFSGARG